MTKRIAIVMPLEPLAVPAIRATRWGLYLAQRGAASDLPMDFGLGHRRGAHRVELAAGTCQPPRAAARPAEVPAQLPTRPDPCERCNELGHFATVRLIADPAADVAAPHEGVHEVCPCCAFPTDQPGGGLYDEMRAQARTSGHVAVELRQPDGSWT